MDGERKQNESDVQRPEDRGPESRRAPLEGHSCEWCEGPLTGRKLRFCSDRCRMRHRRKEQAARINGLLRTIEESVASLRGELEGDHDTP
jgi:hypothetical protein